MPTNWMLRTVRPAGAALRSTCLKRISRRGMPRLVRVRTQSFSRTALMAERICCAAEATVAKTSALVGRISERNHWVGSSSIGTHPVAGSNAQLIAKSVTKKIATTKFGTANPAIAKNCTRRSIAPPLTAAVIPRTVARTAAIKIAPRTKVIVIGRRARIVFTISSLVNHEIPKSPVTALVSQAQ